MPEEPSIQRVEVSFVGAPPAQQVERASGVNDVEIDGPVLRCYVCGSFQPFLEALRGHEVINLTSTSARSGTDGGAGRLMPPMTVPANDNLGTQPDPRSAR